METISASVGKKGINKYKDVTTVQTLLNNNIYRLIPLRPLAVDGDCGAKTIDMIIEFQNRIVRLNNPDGRVDPGSRTLSTRHLFWTKQNASNNNFTHRRYINFVGQRLRKPHGSRD